MGNCCAKEEDALTQPSGGERQRNPRAFSNQTLDTFDHGDNLDSFDEQSRELMTSRRRMTVQERDEQAEHFLSFMSVKGFKKIERFTEHYSVRKELGAGAFGSVKLGKHRRSDVPCAIKIIHKTKLRERRVF